MLAPKRSHGLLRGGMAALESGSTVCMRTHFRICGLARTKASGGGNPVLRTFFKCPRIRTEFGVWAKMMSMPFDFGGRGNPPAS